MPLLSLEPCLFPDNILQAGKPASPGQWWVLHTKPRAEKSLARRLLKQRIAFFLPVYHRTWRSARRTRTSFLPLFPGYLFLCGDNQDRVHALASNLVARTLEVHDQQKLEDDLIRIHRLIESDAPLSPEARLEPGTPVEIVSGPLTGIEGKIIRRGKNLKFFVEVHFLQQGVSVEVEASMFQAIV
jgi:transcription antitermination factor NusG